MQRLKASLGYSAAVFTIAIAVLGPLFWFGFFDRLAASSGLRIDPTFTGGSPAQTIHRSSERGSYDVVVYRPVPRRAPFGSEPFIQAVFKPASALPAAVRESIALPGSGEPGFVAAFDCPSNTAEPLRLNVTALSPRVVALQRAGRDQFTRLIVRMGDSIVIRVPLR